MSGMGGKRTLEQARRAAPGVAQLDVGLRANLTLAPQCAIRLIDGVKQMRKARRIFDWPQPLEGRAQRLDILGR